MKPTPPRALAQFAFIALLLIQPLWHCWLHPPQQMAAWLATSLAALPLLPSAWGLLRHWPNTLFYTALLSLVYFSYGVMEAFADPAVRALALLQVAASTLLVLAVGWDGLLRRRAARQRE